MGDSGVRIGRLSQGYAIVKVSHYNQKEAAGMDVEKNDPEVALREALSSISPARHIFGWSAALPLLALTVTLVLSTLSGFSPQERFGLVVIAVLVTLPLGVALGVASYFVARGAAQWGGIFARMRVQRESAQEAQEIEDAADALVAQDEEQAAAEWASRALEDDEYPAARPQSD